MAPKRRDYGEAGRRGRKDDPVWNLLKDGGTEELKNSAAQIISKLLLGDDNNENGMILKCPVNSIPRIWAVIIQC